MPGARCLPAAGIPGIGYDAGMGTRVRYRFDPHHPEVAAICCSDGRYIRALEEYLAARNIDGHDLMALPGGAAQLCRESASYTSVSVYTDALDFLMRSHHTAHVVLAAHADCGYYRSYFGRADRSRQEDDLRRVASSLRDRMRGLRVEAVFASPAPDDQGGGFVFEDVPLEGR